MKVSELYLRQLVRSSLARQLIKEADEEVGEAPELSPDDADELDVLVDVDVLLDEAELCPCEPEPLEE